MVELYIDNLMRGIIKIGSYNGDENKLQLLEKFKQWSKLYHNDVKYAEFNQLTEELYDKMIDFRAWGNVIGELKEVENEKLIESLKQDLATCKEHNKILAEQLSQSYIPTKDEKVDTN